MPSPPAVPPKLLRMVGRSNAALLHQPKPCRVRGHLQRLRTATPPAARLPMAMAVQLASGSDAPANGTVAQSAASPAAHQAA